MKNYRMTILALVVALAMIVAVGCVTAPATNPTSGNGGNAAKGVYTNLDANRTYYMCSSHQAHPYFADSHIALRYAAEYFNVKIVALGPDAWDTAAQAAAIDQAIAKNPAGIITRFWDASPLAAVKKATEAGIPVVVTETRIGDAPADIGGAMTYIGLNNYQCGRDTAAELVKQAKSDSGKLVCMGNWGASNTDAKLQGVKDYLKEKYPNWIIVAEVDDKADAAAAIEAGKSVINNYKDITAIVGLDSSSGSGISTAMQELNIAAGKFTVVVHDREPATLKYIGEGFINATLCNKTATDEYLAILLMEDYNNGGLKNVPLSSDNKAAGISACPENMFNTAFAITKDNVKYFTADVMPKITTSLYNK